MPDHALAAALALALQPAPDVALPDAALSLTPPPAAPGQIRVQSREDYFALTPRERERFNRQRRGPVNLFLETQADFIASADANGRNGEVSIRRVGATFGPSFRLGDRTDLAIQFQTETSFYGFNDAAGFVVPGDTTPEPFDNAQVLSVTPALNHVNFDGFSFVLGARFVSSGEIDADFGETLTVGGFFVGSYQFTPRLRLGMGFQIASKLSSDNVVLLPVPVFVWNITEQLSLASDRGAIRFAYQPNYAWEFAVESTFQRREFRLAEDASIPEGVVIDTTIPVNLSVAYLPHPRFNVVARVGAAVWGEFEFFTPDQSRVSDIEREPAFFGGLELRLRF